LLERSLTLEQPDKGTRVEAKMLPQDFQRNFPQGSEAPRFLIRLLEYQNSNRGHFYSGDFELTGTGAEAALAWFDNDQSMASQFVIFGQGGDGSLYGYWLYAGQTLDTAPIVFLGSEGMGNTVLAHTLEEFLALLAVGMEKLGYDVSEGWYWEEEIEPGEQVLRFRSWLEEELGIVKPEDWREIVAQAKESHPDLDVRIEQWARAHFRLGE
jgi:hypothetical protein